MNTAGSSVRRQARRAGNGTWRDRQVPSGWEVTYLSPVRPRRARLLFGLRSPVSGPLQLSAPRLSTLPEGRVASAAGSVPKGDRGDLTEPGIAVLILP